MSSLAIAAATSAVMMIGCWLVSLRLRDASIVDPLWGLVFVAMAWVLWLNSGGGGRKLLMLAMVTLWGMRLAIHLALRKRGTPEDYRYTAMRRRWQPFTYWSLVIVFGLQGLLATIVSLPLVAVMGADPNGDAALSSVRWNAGGLGWLDLAGATVWTVGLIFEAVADHQLAGFRAAQARRGEVHQVMDRGLWRYSRHPNYFGDFLVWWGIYLVAAAAGAWWSIIGPAVMTLLLVRVSGVALLERTISKRRPGYADYAARTSAFIPLPPRRNPRSTSS